MEEVFELEFASSDDDNDDRQASDQPRPRHFTSFAPQHQPRGWFCRNSADCDQVWNVAACGARCYNQIKTKQMRAGSWLSTRKRVTVASFLSWSTIVFYKQPLSVLDKIIPSPQCSTKLLLLPSQRVIQQQLRISKYTGIKQSWLVITKEPRILS
jgi:hypothetical protein